MSANWQAVIDKRQRELDALTASLDRSLAAEIAAQERAGCLARAAAEPARQLEASWRRIAGSAGAELAAWRGALAYRERLTVELDRCHVAHQRALRDLAAASDACQQLRSARTRCQRRLDALREKLGAQRRREARLAERRKDEQRAQVWLATRAAGGGAHG